MSQEVKNPLRAQSKYGLMGSSAKTGKLFFRGSPEHFLDKNAIWDRTPPKLTHQLQSTCVQEGSRVPNLQTEFNYLDLFKSYGIFSDFVVPTWSPSSSHRPHSPQKVPMWSPWSVVSMVSTCCPLSSSCHPHIIHVIPVIPTSSPHCPHHPHHPCIIPIAPRRSPCGLHGLWSLWSPHVVPVIPMLSPSSPHHPHII